MKELTIEPKTEGKGRSFSATLVACVEARDVVPRGNDTIRPVFMALAGTDQELRPFVANLRTGKKAEVSTGYRRGDKYEILKSAGYQCTWQRTPKGTVVTLFAPDLFCLDPGMVDPKGVTFCMLPSRAWLKPLDVPVPKCVPADRADDVRSLAALFVAYLDRRTRCPLVPDPRFYVNVLAGALDEGLATFSRTDAHRYQHAWGESSGRYDEEGTEHLGMAPGIFFCTSHETLETFLAAKVREHFGVETPPKSRRAA